MARASHDYLSSIDQSNFVKRKIAEETRLAWSGLDTSRQRVTLLQNAVNIAAEVFSGRRKLREAGKETVINVLDAESQMFDARIQSVAAQHDARIAVYRLLAAMGILNLDTISRLAALPASSKVKVASVVLNQDDTAMEEIKEIEEVVTSAGDIRKDDVQQATAKVPENDVTKENKLTITAAAQPEKNLTNGKQPTVPSPRSTNPIQATQATAENKTEKTDTHNQADHTDGAKTVVAPTKIVMKANLVKVMATPENKLIRQGSLEIQPLISGSALPLQTASYPVDGDPNFIRAWPYE